MLKVTSLCCLVLTRGQLFRLELTTPCSKVTGSQRTGGKEIAYTFCALILQSFINNPRLRSTPARNIVAMPQSVLGFRFFCTANSSFLGWHRVEGQSTLPFSREKAVSYTLFWSFWLSRSSHFGYVKKTHSSEALSWGGELKAIGEGRRTEAKTFWVQFQLMPAVTHHVARARFPTYC